MAGSVTAEGPDAVRKQNAGGTHGGGLAGIGLIVAAARPGDRAGGRGS